MHEYTKAKFWKNTHTMGHGFPFNGSEIEIQKSHLALFLALKCILPVFLRFKLLFNYSLYDVQWNELKWICQELSLNKHPCDTVRCGANIARISLERIEVFNMPMLYRSATAAAAVAVTDVAVRLVHPSLRQHRKLFRRLENLVSCQIYLALINFC